MADKGDAPNCITENVITLQCFKGQCDREGPEAKKGNEYKESNFVRP